MREVVHVETQEQYDYVTEKLNYNYYNDTLRDKEYVLNDAKHHALICIEEQIELLTKIDPPRDFRNSSFSMELMKLKQLKQEIEKL